MPESDTLGILALEGDLDLYQTPTVKGKMEELIRQQNGRILVDLTKVTYIDSSGLAFFIECLQRIGAYGGKLGLFGLQPTIQHIFEIARLDQVLHIYSDEKAARAAL